MNTQQIKQDASRYGVVFFCAKHVWTAPVVLRMTTIPWHARP